WRRRRNDGANSRAVRLAALCETPNDGTDQSIVGVVDSAARGTGTDAPHLVDQVPEGRVVTDAELRSRQLLVIRLPVPAGVLAGISQGVVGAVAADETSARGIPA